MSADGPAPAVSCRAVSKVYAGAEPVVALDGLDLEAPSGEFLALVGESGSGKSTLLHLLGGIDRPTRGNILVGGRDIGALPNGSSCSTGAARSGWCSSSSISSRT